LDVVFVTANGIGMPGNHNQPAGLGLDADKGLDQHFG
jgi:hypothetical protein